MDGVGYEYGSDFLQRSLENIADHRTVFHALKRSNDFAGIAIDFNLNGHESTKTVSEHDVHPIHGVKKPLLFP
jgi:hypothetical protein